MKICMIAIPGNEISEYYASITTNQWERYGYAVERVAATTPATLGDELRFAKLKFSGNAFTQTEKAIWYSHYYLWERCQQEGTPMCVIEHDCYPTRKLRDFTGFNLYPFCSFPRNDKAWQKLREVVAPGGGYFLTPKAATTLIHRAKESIIRENVDGALHQTMKLYNNIYSEDQFNKEFAPWLSSYQIVNYDLGVTVYHNLEDENETSDISSVCREEV